MKASEIDASYKLSDTGKKSDREEFYNRPRLTLRHLNRLRKIRELRRLEVANHRDHVQKMYGDTHDCDEDSSAPMVPRKTH